MTRALVLALAALAVGAAPAHAGTDWLPMFERAAVSYWGHGQLPPCGQPRNAWVGEAALPAPTAPGMETYAAADPVSCAVLWNVDAWHGMTAPQMCRFVLHEWGHLYDHTHEEGGIMAPYAKLWPTWQRLPCGGLIRSVVRWHHMSGIPQVRWATTVYLPK